MQNEKFQQPNFEGFKPSIHLIWSCYITNKRLRIYPGEIENESPVARLHKFFVTLNSLKNLSIDNYSFFLKFDTEYQHAIPQVKKFINENFKNSEIQLFRLEKFIDWKNVFDEVKTEQILWLTYDDHAFVGKSPNEFKNVQKVLKEADATFPDSLIYGQLSHFPEMISGFEYFRAIGSLFKIHQSLLIPCHKPLGAVIVNANKLRNAWKMDFTNNTKIVSPENPFGPSFVTNGGLGVVPRLELFRHLDGYKHISLSVPFDRIAMPESKDFLQIEKFQFHRIEKFDEQELKNDLAILDSEYNSDIPVLDLCTNRLIIANSRRITLIGSMYTLKNLNISLEIKIMAFIRALLVSKQIRKNLFYIPVDILTVLALKTISHFCLVENRHNLIDLVNQIVSYRLLKFVGIRTSIRGKLSSVIKFR